MRGGKKVSWATRQLELAGEIHRRVTQTPQLLAAQEMGYRPSSFGSVLYVRFFTSDYRAVGWRELWEAFRDRYPGKWAVQLFPPADELVDEENIYHLYVLDEPPQGVSVRQAG